MINNSKSRPGFVPKANLTSKKSNHFIGREFLKEQRIDGLGKVKLWHRFVNSDHKLG